MASVLISRHLPSLTLRSLCARGLGTVAWSFSVRKPSFFLGRSQLSSTQHRRAACHASASSVLAAVEESIGKLSTSPTLAPLNPLVVVISGPSGVGKDAVIKRLQEVRTDLFFVVTATSRPQRPGETHGLDYFFVSKEQFEDWIKAGQLLEYAVVYGDYKGIPRAQVEAALERCTDVVLRLDVQGASTIKKLLPASVSIFLVAESEAGLARRLVARKTEPLDKLLLRVETAREELEHIAEFDYVVVNEDGKLDCTVQAIEAILRAEKCRISRCVLQPLVARVVKK